MPRVLVALLVVVCCTVACYEVTTDATVVALDNKCGLISATGEPLKSLDVKNNDLITWTNQSGETVKFVVSDPKVMSGRRSLRLKPGQRVTVRVSGRAGTSLLTWYCGRDGGSGGNTPVNNGGGGG